MLPKHSVDEYRIAIKKNIGQRIMLHLKRGRRMMTINDCILENAYNNIFIVTICTDKLSSERIISVSYADLLTGNARVEIQKNEKLA